MYLNICFYFSKWWILISIEKQKYSPPSLQNKPRMFFPGALNINDLHVCYQCNKEMGLNFTFGAGAKSKLLPCLHLGL